MELQNYFCWGLLITLQFVGKTASAQLFAEGNLPPIEWHSGQLPLSSVSFLCQEGKTNYTLQSTCSQSDDRACYAFVHWLICKRHDLIQYSISQTPAQWSSTIWSSTPAQGMKAETTAMYGLVYNDLFVAHGEPPHLDAFQQNRLAALLGIHLNQLQSHLLFGYIFQDIGVPETEAAVPFNDVLQYNMTFHVTYVQHISFRGKR